jgi:type I restriction enzyme S subunit
VLGDLLIEGPTNGYSPPSGSNAKGSLSLKLSATTQGRFVLDPHTIKRLHETLPSDSPYWLMPGDLLVQRSNTRELVGTAAIYEGPPATYIYPDLMMRLRFADASIARWVWRYMNSPTGRRFFERIAAGAAGSMPKISGAKLRSMVIPLPGRTERERLLSLLDKADAIRRKRKDAIAFTEELLRSTFLDMFGDPVTNPKGWPLAPLDKMVESITAGWSANGEPRALRDGELGVLKVSAVSSGRFQPDEYKALDGSAVERVLVHPRRGDLLFSRANTRDLVAATCLVTKDAPRVFLPDKLWRIDPKRDLATSGYLRYLLAHPRVKEEIASVATGTSGSMLNVSQTKVKALQVPTPSLELQAKFDAVVWRSLDSEQHLKVAAAHADTLFDALMQRAFGGTMNAGVVETTC